MSAYVEVHLVFEPVDPGRDIALALLADAGCDSFREEGEGLWAYVPEDACDVERLNAVQEQLQAVGLVGWTQRAVPETNWNAVWESEYAPVYFGKRAVLRAPFHASPEAGLDVVIRPEMSFGTGHHPTTKCMVEALLDAPPTGLRVLDMGAGTGVLAVVAVLLGAERALAVEIDAGAAENAQSNVALNGVEGRVEVRCGDATAVTPEDGQFDRVLANINRNVLAKDFSLYDRMAAPGAEIFTSGFFPNDVAFLAEHARDCGWEPVEERTHEGWSCVRWNRMNREPR